MSTAPTAALARYTGLSEADLVSLARSGDEGAIRKLLQDNNQRLFRVARGVVRNDAEAEDIVQDTYVKALSSLSTFRSQSTFATWVTRIALNEAFGRIRRRRPTSDLAAIDEQLVAEGRVLMFPTVPVTENPESSMAREEIRRFLEKAVDDLPETFRLVFILRDIQGLSVEETASYLSVKPATVKTRLHRARGMMRDAFSEAMVQRFSDLYPFDGARCANMTDRVIARLKEQAATPD